MDEACSSALPYAAIGGFLLLSIPDFDGEVFVVTSRVSEQDTTIDYSIVN